MDFPRLTATHEIEEGLVFAPKFDAAGLITCVVSEADSGRMLMVAHMNAEALARTHEAGIRRHLAAITPLTLVDGIDLGALYGSNLVSAMIDATIGRTVSIGTANPMPTLPPFLLAICELMPITRPSRSNSGPPELPWLMAASVWMAFWMVNPLGDSITRSSADTMPVVAVPA